MKRLVFLLALVFMAAGVLFAQVKKGDTAWVSPKTVELKSSTWFFAGTRGTLQMGDQVVVLQVKGNWAEVRASANSSLTGWTSEKNLSSRRIAASGAAVTASEVSMAGKGFSREVEDSYKKQGNYNFADVDKVETNRVPMADLYKFVVDGHLKTGEEQ